MKTDLIKLTIFFVLALAITITVYVCSFKEGVTTAHVVGILLVSAAVTGSAWALYRAIIGKPAKV
jgi:hypothetical protein